MKILFAYFDFTARTNLPFSFHLHEECALNFSTSYNYMVTKKGEACQYIISRKEKPSNECLPDNFWGDRIYNVTAIVGDNGSGKSTILHSIIKTVIMGLDPGVPFLLILQPTHSDQPYLYCSDPHAFTWNGPESYCVHKEYPDGLMKTKSMLLDNTLSLSSYQLSHEYHSKMQQYNAQYGLNLEWQKQFYNKSLYASIQFSNDVSIYNVKSSINPVSDVMSIHFSYESFQETRFLFDRYHQEVLTELENQGYPIPRPKSVTVLVTTPDQLHREYHEPNIYPYMLSYFQLFHYQSFTGQIIIDAIYNLLCYLNVLFRNKQYQSVDDVFELYFAYKNKTITSASDIAEIVLKAIEDINSNYFDNSKTLFENWINFFSFVVSNEDTLSEIFQSSASGYSSNYTEYTIDVMNTISEANKHECVISFLEAYRQICNPRYFLVFLSGMSSGEKNLLRMLTQFRYMLKGPSQYHAHKNGIFLLNKFPQKECLCDSLFLFLDEIDLTYHVEWQRVIISMLTTVLPIMFKKKYFEEDDAECGCHDIQIILATHSPLILGDFPKASVIYLKDNNQATQNSTFGENLYTILKDGFFMNDTIGEFAKRKINTVAEWCSSTREYYEQKRKNDDMRKDLCNTFQQHYTSTQLLPSGKTRDRLIKKLHRCANILGIPNTTRESVINTSSETNLNQKDDDSVSKSNKSTIRSIDNWCSTVEEYFKQIDTNSKLKTELCNTFIKQYEIMQLLPPGIIQNKLILELKECTRKLDIHYPEDKQDTPVMLKKYIDELKVQLELERKLHKEE